MENFYLNQIFENEYPEEAVDFCKQQGLTITEIEPAEGEDGIIRRFQITEIPQLSPEKEEEFVNNLTMTALDFITFLQEAGLTLEQINAYLESNLSVKMQLTYCQNVYCGVAKQLMPITVDDVTITADMVETAFKIKNGGI